MSGRVVHKKCLILLFSMLILCFGVSMTYGASSANYTIDTDVLSGGGGECDSTNYFLNSTTGQPSAIGISSSANYTNYAGFWYTIAQAPQGQLLGDINNDGVVDISDVILDLRCALALPIEPYLCMPCGDINADGKVDISDVILTLRKALQLDSPEQCT